MDTFNVPLPPGWDEELDEDDIAEAPPVAYG